MKEGEDESAGGPILVGIQRILQAAATDTTFREAFYRDREQALRDRRWRLSESDRKTLMAVPDPALRHMVESLPETISRTDPPPAPPTVWTSMGIRPDLNPTRGASADAPGRPGWFRRLLGRK